MILLLLWAFFPLRRRDGEVLGLLMVTYPVTRFLIEYLRNDEGVFFAGLTISQNISVVLFLGGLAYWYWLSRFPRTRLVDQARRNPSRVSGSRRPARELTVRSRSIGEPRLFAHSPFPDWSDPIPGHVRLARNPGWLSE